MACRALVRCTCSLRQWVGVLAELVVLQLRSIARFAACVVLGYARPCSVCGVCFLFLLLPSAAAAPSVWDVLH
jgi:hypothetical protein